MIKRTVTACMVCAVFGLLFADDSSSKQTTNTSAQGRVDIDRIEEETCTYMLWEPSKNYFQSRLIALKPNFVHFKLEFNTTTTYNATKVFYPELWAWTYSSPTASYPYLSWNIDYGLLSFGLLDVKTCNLPYVKINVPNSCNISFGTNETTWKIVETLQQILINMTDSSYHKYERSYFCYLVESPGIRDELKYKAALYFNYPIAFISYKCCELKYMYQTDKYEQTCPDELQQKWIQCTLGPYILGLVIFMYFPILLFEICAWLAKAEVVRRNDHELRDGYVEIDEGNNANWVFLDGKPPLTLLGCFSILFAGLSRRCPGLVSRLRRLLCISVAPAVIFAQVAMYSQGIGDGSGNIKIEDLIAEGTPMGFLSLLGKREDRNKVLAPIFGGPVCLLISYYILGTLFLVYPKSLKQIVERGVPNRHPATPLCLGVEDIINLSMVNVKPEAGYENGATVCKCSIFMLFARPFWSRVFEIQRQRILPISQSRTLIVLLPLYLILCLIEIIICIAFYSIPLFGFVTIMVRGAVKSIFMFRSQNRCMSLIFRNPFTIFLGTVIVFAMFVFYSYSVGLIFLQSFSFICQIIIFCFVAVIVYPSSSFGYLFFFVVLLYYIVRLIRDFGDDYLELLQVAVERSRELYSQVNHAVVFDGQLLVYNIATSRLKGIRVNDTLLDVPRSVWEQINRNVQQRVAEYDNIFGIPRELFNHLIRKHRPIHIQVLKLIFHASLIIFLVAMTLSITSQFATGASSDVSEVMHVIFIVTVGALPRVLEVALMNSSETVRREIEMRRIEQSIVEYWIQKSEKGLKEDP